ncbi:hypothetical protein [Bradyrhizobium sp. SZCCHNR3058]|uniref:hypothetical protein n=1 Tax=Bradyrhizobium sp. SZCCHNR3058 TaxID=3057423 RepID=UPI002915DAB5|nr:hypothetical protein [Bradyrhizobium sp. SZCCHNR3058]
MEKLEAKLAFVRQMSDEFRTTLDASSAMYRLRMLIDDIQAIGKSFEVAPPENPYRNWRTFGVDIVSYYAVGFITCLEWHARARFADFLTFRPGGIKEDDLKKDVSAKVLGRLIAEKMSIPHFVAVTKNISTADSYLSTFVRIFEALDLKPNPNELVHVIPATAKSGAGSGIECLRYVFEYRNALVHEISSMQIGHPLFQDYLDCDDALALGRFVEAVIASIETTISASGPEDFPGKLKPDGTVTDVDSEIEKEISLLESELTQRIGGFSDALLHSRSAMEHEQEMIFRATELHKRWIDLKAPPRRALKRGRLSYLKSLLAALD